MLIHRQAILQNISFQCPIKQPVGPLEDHNAETLPWDWKLEK